MKIKILKCKICNIKIKLIAEASPLKLIQVINILQHMVESHIDEWQKIADELVPRFFEVSEEEEKGDIDYIG